jgi:capsular exopolysaccharide synthesis family protein
MCGSEPTAEVLDGVDEHLVSLLTPASFAAERYRTLRNVLEQLRKSARISIVAITSPTIGDGKTLTAANLAGSLAQAPGARVLLVEADLRRPALRRYLGLGFEGRPGLVDLVLEPRLKLTRVVTPCPPFGLTVLLAGQVPMAPYEVLKSPRLAELLEEARAAYEYVIVDVPPLTPIPDCRVVGKFVDGFFVVVAAHRTPRKLVEEALHGLEPEKILRIVFNEDDGSASGYSPVYGANGNGGAGSRHGWGRILRWAGSSTDVPGGSVRTADISERFSGMGRSQ